MDIRNLIKNLADEGYTDIFVWTDAKGAYYEWHSHPYEEIRIMINGEMIINTGDASYYLKPGDVLKVPAGQIHEAEILEECEYICASKI